AAVGSAYTEDSAPPSVHPSGRRYEWTDLHPDTVPLAPCPEWLLKRLTRRPDRPWRTREEWRELARRTVYQGARNSSIASLAGHLLRKGVDPMLALDFLLAWNWVHCRPPLSDDEVLVTVDSIARAELRRRQRGVVRHAG
ncbi:MAG: primase C-terminal domain-containing protein, partial [Firmicutes bacterium]|nr:primase C-terminal domain-containing protein [Bacillota bacterium]